MIFIAESGATKTDWRAVSKAGREGMVSVRTAGINIAVMPEDEILEVVSEAWEAVKAGLEKSGIGETVTEIHFYAAGLIMPVDGSLPQNVRGLDSVFRTLFPEAKIEYASDLLAAARAVCGHNPGIAAIMGTGSNSCFYDGVRITENIRSAGFILGDEGGAASLGRLFMADFLKGLVPEVIAKEFSSDFTADYMTVVNNVYKSAAPSGYLGSFAPWILARYNASPYLRNLVDGNFKSFAERALCRYAIESHPVGITGGFGFATKEIVERVLGEYGIRISRIIQSPVEGLVEYHLNGK